MITLKNEYLTVKIEEQGAELVSVVDNATEHEFIWKGLPRYWGRHAPVLFPVIGGVKNNQYEHNGKLYPMTKHGFARDMVFQVQATTENMATFYLRSNDETKVMYPFEFSLQITYIVHDRKLTVAYEVLNRDKEPMYYNIGGHPAFNVSQDAKRAYDEVYCSFTPESAYLMFPVGSDGYLESSKEKFVPINQMKLHHSNFKRDALIYHINDQVEISLEDVRTQSKVTMRTNNMTHIGIWSTYPKKAPFVCLEPWAGLPEKDNATGVLRERAGMIELSPHELRSHGYTIAFEKSGDDTL